MPKKGRDKDRDSVCEETEDSSCRQQTTKMRLHVRLGFLLAVSWNENYGADALSPRYRRVPLPENLMPRVFSTDVATECEIPATNGDDATSGIDDPTTAMNTNGFTNGEGLPNSMLELPRHSHEGVNDILTETELLIRQMHRHSKTVDPGQISSKRKGNASSGLGDAIFANSYVDLGKVDTVGYV